MVSGADALAACWYSNAFAPKMTDTAAMATRLESALRRYFDIEVEEFISNLYRNILKTR